MKLTDLTRGLDEPRRPSRWRAIGAGIAALAVVAAIVWAPPVSLPQLATPGARQLKEIQSDSLTNYTKPVQELMLYAQALKHGRASLDPSISGEEAAKRLGYTRLFATAYSELVLIAKKNAERSTLVAALENLVQEEQGIDWLMAQGVRVTSIAYLRALQNGDATFPGPAEWAPTPQAIVMHLSQLHPDVPLDHNDAVFADIYRHTREFASNRAKQAGELSVYEIIAELRRAIIASVVKNPGQSL